MYFYKIYNYDGDCEFLCNENKFTKEEFDKMCREAPTWLNISYDVNNIVCYLVDNYNFGRIEVQADFVANTLGEI